MSTCSFDHDPPAGDCMFRHVALRLCRSVCHLLVGLILMATNSIWTNKCKSNRLWKSGLTLSVHKGSYTATRYLQMYINHLLNTYHTCFFAHWTSTVSGFYVGTESTWTFLLAVLDVLPASGSVYSKLKGYSTQQDDAYISHSYRYIKSVYANRHRDVHLFKRTGKPFMKLSCSNLVWNVQSLGQITPICVCVNVQLTRRWKKAI